ncbi:hypothetical protein [Gordonia zhaorongruii]|uniref:hypothetical protein n=1 Tax=Gordonia zhaorongruii TaxID=2597659 RepID=UPI0010480BC8|nr:hypothetical protein [Gordonia zhaorongruii]
MRTTRKNIVTAAAVTGAALIGTTVGTAPSAEATPHAVAARPITVYQFPSIGVQWSGLVVPGPLAQGVHARNGAKPGDVILSAPGTAYTCSSSAAGALLDIHLANLSDGKSGDVRIRLCKNFRSPVPASREIHTGPGRIAVTVRLAGSAVYPNAGQPSLPGFGVFTVR